MIVFDYLNDDFFSQVRLEVGRVLATTNTTNLKQVRGIGDAFEALTVNPKELSLELQVCHMDGITTKIKERSLLFFYCFLSLFIFFFLIVSYYFQLYFYH